jgi:regulator of nucleoside diphosphate kinase
MVVVRFEDVGDLVESCGSGGEHEDPMRSLEGAVPRASIGRTLRYVGLTEACSGTMFPACLAGSRPSFAVSRAFARRAGTAFRPSAAERLAPGSLERSAVSRRQELTMHNDIVITDIDRDRLLPMLDQHDTDAAESLDAELHRAVIVGQLAIPADVGTMNSEVVYEDVATGARRTVRVVYPKDANATAGRVSVLAPIGTALLGLRTGQTIAWLTPGGMREIRIVEVRYQPEAAGDFGL